MSRERLIARGGPSWQRLEEILKRLEDAERFYRWLARRQPQTPRRTQPGQNYRVLEIRFRQHGLFKFRHVSRHGER